MVKESSGAFRLKADMQGYLPETATTSRIAKLKSSFFLNEEAIKLPRAVAESHKVALAAVHTVAKSNAENATMYDADGTLVPIDCTGPIFQYDKRNTEEFINVKKSYNIDQFLHDLKAQRDALPSQFDKDRFDLVWGSVTKLIYNSISRCD